MEFQGKIGNDWRDSEPWWPPLPTPPEGAPNVLLVVLDDVGFAQLGCYGSDIETPAIDRVAAEGVRLTNFHTTALCSPTRACLLTGRNHHRSGMGRVADLATGFPGYWGRPPRENGFLSEMLRATGYATYAVGKWHLSPEGETNMANSRATWPLGRGFDRWYGFHGGETHQFVPALYHDNHAVRPPRSVEDGYHLSADLADRAIEFLGDLRAVDDELPFSCTSLPVPVTRRTMRRPSGSSATRAVSPRAGTPGARRPSPASWRRASSPKGTVLTPRPAWVPSWESLDERQRTLAERFMECFAAFLSYTDEQIGRVLDFIDDLGDADDTVVIVVSDNGASSEGGKDGTINEGRLSNFEGAGIGEMYSRLDEIGGPRSHNNYPWGWTMAGNTPFKRWKREVHEGGVADPCIVRMPAGRRAEPGGEVRRQYAHAVDITPTRARARRDRATGRDRRRRPVPPRRLQLRLRARPGGPDRTRPAHHAALRNARLAGDLPRWLEGGHLSPGRPDLRRRFAVERAVGRRRVGALPRHRGCVRVTRPRCRAPREGR